MNIRIFKKDGVILEVRKEYHFTQKGIFYASNVIGCPECNKEYYPIHDLIRFKDITHIEFFEEEAK